jgi:hypothetical protein
MNLSKCGRFVYIPGNPDAVPLPGADPFESTDTGFKPINSVGGICLQKDHGKPQNADISPFKSQSRQVLRSDNTETPLDDSRSQWLTVKEDRAISLKLQDASGNSETSLHLLSIPGWNEDEKVTQAIFLSTEDHAGIKIVMDKEGEKVYNLDKKRKENFPLVIDRDISAVIIERKEGRHGDKLLTDFGRKLKKRRSC